MCDGACASRGSCSECGAATKDRAAPKKPGFSDAGLKDVRHTARGLLYSLIKHDPAMTEADRDPAQGTVAILDRLEGA
jgi:hypothetical protein